MTEVVAEAPSNSAHEGVHSIITRATDGIQLRDWQESSRQVIEAAQRLGRAVKPVLRIQQGSGGRELFGSAFIVEHHGQYAVVTAAHVVEDGPEPRYLAVSEDGSTRWPAQHSRIVAKASDAPDPDIACARFSLALDASRGATDAFPLVDVLDGLQPERGMTFLAVGHPVSRGKIRYPSGTLHAGLAHISGDAIPLDEYDQLRLDPRVHLAMRYVPTEVRLPDGSVGRGPALHGMSGGVLLLMTKDSSGEVQLLPAGVITAYRPGPPGIVVATRMDAVLDHLAPRRPPEQQQFERD